MSMFGFMGSESKSSSTSQTITKPADQRIGVEGGLAGQLIGPEAVVAQGGGITARTGDYSPLTQSITGNKFKMGLSGAEVKSLLEQQTVGFQTAATSAAATNAKLAELATTALTAQTGVPADWIKYVVPLGVIVAVVVIAKRKRRPS